MCREEHGAASSGPLRIGVNAIAVGRAPPVGWGPCCASSDWSFFWPPPSVGVSIFGVKHRNDELIRDPEALLAAYKEALKNTASDKMEKIKKVILEE